MPIDVIENCHECAGELEMVKLFQDCPHCGAGNVVACHACEAWMQQQDTHKCQTCNGGGNFEAFPTAG